MKVSRKILKALIKECLLELLTEGLGDQVNESVRNIPRRGGQPRPQPMPPTHGQGVFTRSTHHAPPPTGGASIPTDALRRAVVQEAGGDPIMQDILADTAMTTLPSRLASEGPNGAPVALPRAGLAEAVVAEIEDPAQLVGEQNASRWASLAFEAKSSRSHLPPPPPPLPAPVDLDAPVGQPKKTA